ncbi:unnamed protein product [Ambrosiozyma monospora]|uniref:Unnamed protein product n=1 Tax=Ambrosiozyma monospora TaxID=43982 RepID=A0ACB5T442_AMBMO|nr:unnamed protein product [Ambrosiozyma monospora]
MHNLTLSANKPKPSFPTKTTLKSLINFDTIVQYVDWSSVDLSSMANSKVLTLNVVVTNSLKDLVIVKLNIGFDDDENTGVVGAGNGNERPAQPQSRSQVQLDYTKPVVSKSATTRTTTSATHIQSATAIGGGGGGSGGISVGEHQDPLLRKISKLQNLSATSIKIVSITLDPTQHYLTMLYQFKLPQQSNYLDLRMYSQLEDLFVCVLPLFDNTNTNTTTNQLTTASITASAPTITTVATSTTDAALARDDGIESIGGSHGGLGGTSTGGIGFTGSNNIDEFGGDRRKRRRSNHLNLSNPYPNHTTSANRLVNGYGGCVGYDLIHDCFGFLKEDEMENEIGNGKGNGSARVERGVSVGERMDESVKIGKELINVGSASFNPNFVNSLLKLDEFYRGVPRMEIVRFVQGGGVGFLKLVQCKFDLLVHKFQGKVQELGLKQIVDDVEGGKEGHGDGDVEMTTAIFNTAGGKEKNDAKKEKQKKQKKETELDPFEVLADELYRGFEINQLRLLNVVSGMYLDGLKLDIHGGGNGSVIEIENENEKEKEDKEESESDVNDDEEDESKDDETGYKKSKEKEKQQVEDTTTTTTKETPAAAIPKTTCNFNLMFLKLIAKISIMLVDSNYIELQDELDELIPSSRANIKPNSSTNPRVNTRANTRTIINPNDTTPNSEFPNINRIIPKRWINDKSNLPKKNPVSENDR